MSSYFDGCVVHVWRPEGTNDVLKETNIGEINNIEKDIIEVISTKATEALRVSYSEKDLVRRLLASNLEEDIKVLLEDYLHSQLEIIGRKLNKTFDIDEKIGYEYATHAKLNKYIDAIVEKFGLKVFGEDDLNPTNTIRGKNVDGVYMDEMFNITKIDQKQGGQDHDCHIEPGDAG